MKTYLPYLHYLRPHWRKLLLGTVCGVIFGASSGIGIPVIMEQVFRRAFESEPGTYGTLQIIGIAAAIPLIFMLRSLFGFVSGILAAIVGLEVGRQLQGDIFDKLQTLPLKFFDFGSRGDILVRVREDSARIQETLVSSAPELIRLPFQSLAAICALIYLSVVNKEAGFLISFLVFTPMCLIPVQLIGRNLRRRAQLMIEASADVTQHLWENFSALVEIRSFNLEEAQRRGFRRRINQLFINFLKLKKYSLLQQPSMELVVAVLMGFVFAYAFFRGMNFSSFAALGFALYFAVDPIKTLGKIVNNFNQTSPNFRRITEFFDLPVEISDPAEPVEVDRLRGEISFQQASFGYRPEERVLHDIHVTIPAGCYCALVGPSGAGKSTFAKLIPRFYEITSGSVFIDGIDVRAMRQADLRRNVAFVSQHPVLFNDTLYHNILLGSPNAAAETVEDAARRAYADHFIRGFPDGYDTLAGERGDRLSGGQKQRIALARAFLKNAPIVILDEATSALDSESEAFIQKAMEELALGKTVIAIAHRLSTIRHADMILVFEAGRIAAAGSHGELLESSPLYRELVEKQSL